MRVADREGGLGWYLFEHDDEGGAGCGREQRCEPDVEAAEVAGGAEEVARAARLSRGDSLRQSASQLKSQKCKKQNKKNTQTPKGDFKTAR